MKQAFIVLACSLAVHSYGQQALSSRLRLTKPVPADAVILDLKKQEKEIKNAKDGEKANLKKRFDAANELYKDKVISFRDVTTWGIYGIGNLNTESFSNVNAAGKFSGYKRLDASNKSFTTLYFSFNKNATNNDSLLAGTFLFPDVGNTSLSLTLDHTAYLGKNGKSFHLIGPFFEFSQKNIKVIDQDITRRFSTLNYTIGVKYQNWTPGADMDVNISFCPYFSLVNVPDEDNDDYRFLFKAPTLKSEVYSVGFKLIAQFNNFQAFADLRSVLGSANSIPVRELRGFNSNLGFVFNADIIEK